MSIHVPEEVKPHYNKIATYIRTVGSEGHVTVCFDCSLYSGEFSVVSPVWKAAVPGYGLIREAIQSEGWRKMKHKEAHSRKFIAALGVFLCLSCLERRLGRHITLEDLTSVPINYNLRVAFRAGHAAAQADAPHEPSTEP